MSGEFVTLEEGQKITKRLVADGNTYCVDIANLMLYINQANPDQIYIQKGINDDYSETQVITCYKNSSPVYYNNGDGNSYVLEHITPPPPPPTTK